MPAPRPVRFLGSVAAWFGHAGTFILVSLLAGGLFAGLLIPFAAGIGIAARDGAESFQNTEVDPLVVGELPGRTVMVAGDGSPITTFYRENRQELTLAQISPQLQQALLAIEDRRFYEHGPVDLRGVLRALVANLQAGEVEEGASTLTMQYARNLLVREAGDDQVQLAAALAATPERKIAEIKYAIALEEQYSKDQILEGYLNTVFFGNRSYGIEVAARNYFSVNASALSLPQAATLAGLVQD
ncbi:MAG: transglycosylase domain-containing protein, partial [Sporichthyaceae bacterium]|nr:transglycosylase domain-containing protein [Sporichthyaceae bacterium]